MSSSFGKNIRITLFGESHGPSIGVVIEGFIAGIPIDLEAIKSQLYKRSSKTNYSTERKEKDELIVSSGLFNGFTTGSPLTFLIENQDVHSKHYEPNIMRPSHADYPLHIKHNGYNDYRGGGHSSARITVGLVIAGAIAMQLLSKKKILIGSHISKIKHFEDEMFPKTITPSMLNTLNEMALPFINKELVSPVESFFQQVKEQKDSVGGIIESAVLHLPIGLGEPFFDSLESVISHLLFSIPSVKGVEFGEGFQFVEHFGSTANDPMEMNDEDVHFLSNHNGGIVGGLTTGQPLLVKTVFKPIPSIKLPQQTINLESKTTIEHTIIGRHDATQMNRVIPIVHSALAIAILDLLVESEGKQWMI